MSFKLATLCTGLLYWEHMYLLACLLLLMPHSENKAHISLINLFPELDSLQGPCESRARQADLHKQKQRIKSPSLQRVPPASLHSFEECQIQLPGLSTQCAASEDLSCGLLAICATRLPIQTDEAYSFSVQDKILQYRALLWSLQTCLCT